MMGKSLRERAEISAVSELQEAMDKTALLEVRVSKLLSYLGNRFAQDEIR